jgi:hypothetical protein
MLEFQYFQIERFHVKVIVFSDSRYVQLQHVRVPLQKTKRIDLRVFNDIKLEFDSAIKLSYQVLHHEEHPSHYIFFFY